MGKRKKRKASRKHKPTRKSKLKKQQLEEEIKLETKRLEEEKKMKENAPETITDDEQIDKILETDSQKEESTQITESIEKNVDLIEDEAAISRMISKIEKDEDLEGEGVNSDDTSQNQEVARETEDADCVELKKKNKTLIAIIIVLAGVAVGSLFVDVAQLFSGRGFSAKALEDAQVVEYDGSTWVRYDDPKIVVDVFTADDCEDCMTDEVLVRLRSLIPTLEAHRVNVRTEEGKEYAKQNGVKYIPSFVFSEGVINSDFYQGAAILFDEVENGKYYLKATEVGVPIGEYLEKPTQDSGVTVGKEDASNILVVYTDFTCSTCDATYKVIKKIQDDLGDNVKVVFKLTSDSEEKYSNKITRGVYCANKQGKFEPYVQTVFDNKKDLLDSEEITNTLVDYAAKQNLDTKVFEDCLMDKKTKEIIEKNNIEAVQFGITTFPTIFVNGQLHSGIISYDSLKEKIEN